MAITVPTIGSTGWGTVLNAALTALDSGKVDKSTTAINVKNLGAVGDGVTDDVDAFQTAINTALSTGGSIYVPPGTYLISARSLVPAIRTAPATFTSGAGKTLRISGAGAHQTTILAGQQFNFIGIFGYGESGVHPNIATLEVSDLTLDGNYSGAGGTISQPATGAGALVSVYAPDLDSSGHRNGKYHTFRNVRFYRPTGYGFQPTLGVRLIACEFDTMGQPAAGSIHYDNIGSGEGDAIVMGCNWHDSTGNYLDFVDASSTGFVRTIFMGNTSVGHGSGGVYGLGNRSVIIGNVLENSGTGGIGYDVGTHANVRKYNIVTGNTLTNIGIQSLSAANGDRVTGDNVASDLSFVNTGTLATFNTTSSETDFATFVIPANDAAPGVQYRCRVRFFASTTGTPNLSINVNIGSNLVAAVRNGVATASGISFEAGELEFVITVISTGAAGQLTCDGKLVSHFTTGSSTSSLDVGTTRNVPNTDTTVNQTVHVTGQFSASSVSNQINGNYITIERISGY